MGKITIDIEIQSYLEFQVSPENIEWNLPLKGAGSTDSLYMEN